MTKFVNVTPHILNIHGQGVTVVEPSGVVARVSMTSEVVETINGISISKTTIGALDIPEPHEGVIYIASLIMASRAASLGRTDVVSPGSLVRDDAGQPIGCKGLNLPS